MIGKHVVKCVMAISIEAGVQHENLTRGVFADFARTDNPWYLPEHEYDDTTYETIGVFDRLAEILSDPAWIEENDLCRDDNKRLYGTVAHIDPSTVGIIAAMNPEGNL